MTQDDIRARINADADLAAAVRSALDEQLDATAAWESIADTVCAGRTRRRGQARMTELDVRGALPLTQAVPLLRTLRELHDAAVAPQWLTDALTEMGKPEAEHIIYLDTLQCGWRWLQSDRGLDVADDTTRTMLTLLAAVRPALMTACGALLAAGHEPDIVTELDVRRAVLADDGTVRI